jgi:hypothetical protein
MRWVCGCAWVSSDRYDAVSSVIERCEECRTGKPQRLLGETKDREDRQQDAQKQVRTNGVKQAESKTLVGRQKTSKVEGRMDGMDIPQLRPSWQWQQSPVHRGFNLHGRADAHC